MKVAGYIRVSTVEQATSGLSLQAQTELIEQFCKDNQYELVGIYADEGKSANKSLQNRAALLRMLSDAESGKFQIIAFKDITRWSRNAKQFYAVQDRLDNCKVGWIAIQQPYLGTTSPTNRFQTNIMIGTAQLEAEQTGERIRFVQDSQVRNGNYPFPDHAAATGYRIEHTENGTKLIVDEDKRNLVIDMFDKFIETANAGKTSRYISDKYGWNVKPTNIIRMLKNKIYIGTFRGIPDFVEPIIPYDTFCIAQNLLQNRGIRKCIHADKYVFSGLLRCGKCGSTMCGNTYEGKHGNVYRYQCHTYQCRTLVRQDEIERKLIRRIDDILNGYRFLIDKGKQKKTDYEELIKAEKGKLNRLTELYIDGDISKETYLKRKESTESRLNEIESEMRTETESEPPLLDLDWKQTYYSLKESARNRFWKMCLSDIVTDGTDITDVKFLSFQSTKVLAESFDKIKDESNLL